MIFHGPRRGGLRMFLYESTGTVYVIIIHRRSVAAIITTTLESFSINRNGIRENGDIPNQ